MGFWAASALTAAVNSYIWLSVIPRLSLAYTVVLLMSQCFIVALTLRFSPAAPQQKQSRHGLLLFAAAAFIACAIAWALGGRSKTVALLLAFSSLTMAASTWASANRPASLTGGVIVAAATLLISLMAIDLALFAGLLDRRLPTADLAVIPAHHVIVTPEGYRTGVMEPNYYGEMFGPGQIATYLEDSGFYEPRRIVVETDEVGLRNSRDAFGRSQDVVLLGDSFTFGYGTSQGDTWAEALARLSGLHVYNAGVYGTGPSQEIELLLFLVNEKGLKINPGATIFVLVFEGNDFSDPSAYRSPEAAPEEGTVGRYFRRTLGRRLFLLAQNLKEGTYPRSEYLALSSQTFGKVGFRRQYIDVVETNYSGDLDQHMRANGMSRAFDRLHQLKVSQALSVVIVFAPEKWRVYREYYSTASPPIGANDFKDRVRDLARQQGFAFWDLEPMFKDCADKGYMLFWRDDTHWNVAGNLAVARLSLLWIREASTGVTAQRCPL